MSGEGNEAPAEPWTKLKEEIAWRRNRERADWNANQALLLEMTAKITLDQCAPIKLFFKTSPDWKCPCCEYGKREIASSNKHGRLLLNLVLHHDHIEDFARSFLFDLAPEWRGRLPTRVATRLQQISAVMRRFAPVVICQRCNMLDTEAARMAKPKPPPFFSFSSDEISKMIDRSTRYSEGVVRLKEDRVLRLTPYALTQHNDVLRDMRTIISTLVSRARNDDSDDEFFLYRTAGYKEEWLPQARAREEERRVEMRLVRDMAANSSSSATNQLHSPQLR